MEFGLARQSLSPNERTTHRQAGKSPAREACCRSHNLDETVVLSSRQDSECGPSAERLHPLFPVRAVKSLGRYEPSPERQSGGEPSHSEAQPRGAAMRRFVVLAGVTSLLILLIGPRFLRAKDNKRAEAEALLQRARELSDIRVSGTTPFHLHAEVILWTSAKESVKGSYSLLCESKSR
jgi:hypothetical protein